MTYALVGEQLVAQLQDPEAQKRWLVLGPHADFAGHWLVDGFSNEFMYYFDHIIGSYRALAPAGLPAFMAVAEEHDYKIAFFDDPVSIMDEYEDLDQPPEVEVNSPFKNTTNGMFFFQVQGFNMLKDLPWGVARWDTGTGKTVLASALTKYHQQEFDICFFVVKQNNKVNTARKLKNLVGLDALCINGPRRVRAKDKSWRPGRREKLFTEIRDRLDAGERGIVVVLNYETFRDDFTQRGKKGLELTEWGEAFFPGRKLMFVWDEMPVKLKNRTSELYKAICKCLYRTDPPQVRADRLVPASMRSYMLSATPIENSPEDWFNNIRLMDGGKTYGTVSDFHRAHVCRWNSFDPTKPADFHNYERMRLKAAHFVHQVDKTDPKIAEVFPKAIPEVIYVDWDERNAAIYNEIQDLAAGEVEGVALRDVPIFSLIGTLQMMCDAPEMINDSAARREVWEDAFAAWEQSPEGRAPHKDGSEFALSLSARLCKRLSNKGHPKLDRLREILLERHPEAQAAIYTKFNKALIPYLKAGLEEWGVSYVHYTGQQSAQDAFQNGEVRVFLASDSGSDSIDLDAGNVVVDYDLPWKWTTITQRHNRVHRPTSDHDTVYYYTLLMEGSVEERVLQIIEKKKNYHNQLFNPAAGDPSASGRMTREELMYILTGQ